jgi:Family of unknown function (DUF5675)
MSFQHVHRVSTKILSVLILSALTVYGTTKYIASNRVHPTRIITVLSLERDNNTRQTVVTGKLYLNDVYFCDTTESKIIPPGRYYARIYKSPKLKHNVILLDVPGRTGIEIHAGTRSTGCIILSRPDFARLMSLVNGPLVVEIS